MNILLFDHNELLASCLQALLAKENISLFYCRTVSQLYHEIERQDPQLILLDMFNNEDAFVIAKEILLFRPKQIIIFFSDKQHDLHHLRAHKIGAKGFISRTLPLPHFIEKIKKFREGYTNLRCSSLCSHLIRREKAVIEALIHTGNQCEAANYLFMSKRALCYHLQSIRQKLAVKSTLAAIVYCIQQGLVYR